MHKEGEIRVIALGLIRNGDKIFVSEGYDPVKQEKILPSNGWRS